MTQYLRQASTGRLFVATAILSARPDLEVVKGDPFADAVGPTKAATEATGLARSAAADRAAAKRLATAETAATAAHGRIETLEREISRLEAALGSAQVELTETAARADSATMALEVARAAAPAPRGKTSRAFATTDSDERDGGTDPATPGAAPFGFASE